MVQICLKCHKTSDKHPLEKGSDGCKEHDWRPLHLVTKAYAETPESDARTQKASERIVKIIDDSLKVGRILAIAFGVGAIGWLSLYNVPQIQTKLEKEIDNVKTLTSNVGTLKRDLEEKISQAEIQGQALSRIANLNTEVISVMNNVQERLDTIKEQRFSREAMASLGISRGEYEELVAEIQFTRNRLRTKLQDLFTPDSQKSLSIDKIKRWRRGLNDFTDGFKLLHRRNPELHPNYFDDGRQAYLESINNKIPEFPDPYIKLAAIHLDRRARGLGNGTRLGWISQGRRYLDDALKLEPGNSEALTLYGYYHLLSGEPEKALNILKQIPLDPKEELKYPRSLINFVKGLSLAAQEKYNAAVERFEDVLKDIPNHGRAQNNIVYYIASGKADKERFEYTWVKLIQRGNEAVEEAINDRYFQALRKETLALAYFDFGEFEDAVRQTIEALDKFPMKVAKERFLKYLGCALYFKAREMGESPPPRLSDKCGNPLSGNENRPRGEKYPHGLLGLARLYFVAAQTKYWISVEKTLEALDGFVPQTTLKSQDSFVSEVQLQKELYKRAIERVSEALFLAMDKKFQNEAFRSGEAWSRLAAYLLVAYEELHIKSIFVANNALGLRLGELPKTQKLLKKEKLFDGRQIDDWAKNPRTNGWGYKVAKRLYVRSLQNFLEGRPDTLTGKEAAFVDHSLNNMAWAGLVSQQGADDVASIRESIRTAIRERFLARSGEREDRPPLYDTLAEAYSREGQAGKAVEITNSSLNILAKEKGEIDHLENRFKKVRTRLTKPKKKAIKELRGDLERRRGYLLCQLDRFLHNPQKKVEDCLECLYISVRGRLDCQ